ncbi:hypothetical protein ACFRCX_30315 [Streptomyces sp. NPDC056652]|uniref:hypothetical protein n=1 Tax=Streptomyces sp. NPDC056652 TaxID=3345893 RepID=UPI0036C4EFB8
MTTNSKPKTNAPAAASKDAHWSATLERLKARHRPTATLTICDDHTVKQNLAQARLDQQRAAALVEASTPDDEAARKNLEAADQRLRTAKDAHDAVAIVLRFQALESSFYQELLAAHKPTEEQAEEGYDFNRDTLIPVLLAESSLDGMTVENATFFLNTWSSAEAQALANTVLGVQRDLRMDLGKD